MTQVEQIKAEIERLEKESQDAYRPQDDNNFLFGKVTACEEMLELIDSMQEESCPDFEAEWKRYTASRKDDMRTNAVTMNVKEVALYFAKWGRKQVLTAKPSEELEEEIHRYFKELEKSDCVSNTRRLAKHFAEWGAEHLKSNH